MRMLCLRYASRTPGDFEFADTVGGFADQPEGNLTVTSYEASPPPEDQTEGWKPDPLGSDKVRYWDGSAWTGRIGTVTKVSGAAKSGSGHPMEESVDSTWKTFSSLPTGVQVAVWITVGVLLVGLIAVFSGEDDQGTTTSNTPTQGGSGGSGEQRSGRVEFQIVSVEEGVADPYGDNDPVFNDNHTIVSVKYRLKNGTSERVAPDFYLSGADGYSVNGVELDEVAGLALVDPGEKHDGEVLFGYLTMELPPLRLRVDDIQSGKVLYQGDI